MIDGFGTRMYINHSCDPNCETENDDGRVWITSLRRPRHCPGEELTYEYNLYDSDEDDPRLPLRRRHCRTTMYSAEEIVRRKKAAQRKALKAAGKRIPSSRK